MEMQSICIAIILKCNDLILRNKYVAQMMMMSRNAVDRCNNRRMNGKRTLRKHTLSLLQKPWRTQPSPSGYSPASIKEHIARHEDINNLLLLRLLIDSFVCTRRHRNYQLSSTFTATHDHIPHARLSGIHVRL